MNPKTEVEWGAHAPRVQFSAPSRKTMSAPTIARRSKFVERKSAGHEARPATPEGGCAPQFRYSI